MPQLAVWNETMQAPPEIDSADIPLADLEEAVQQLDAALAQLDHRLKQLRAECEARVTGLMEQLHQADLDVDTFVVADHTLDELNTTRLADLSDEVLMALAGGLSANLNSLLAQARQNEVPVLAARWRETRDEVLLQKLLGRLVRDQRMPEAALLLFSTQALRPVEGMRWLPASIVRGVFNGLVQLSSNAQPFELLSALALDLHSGWLPPMHAPSPPGI